VVRILVEATGLDAPTCAAAAERADGDCRVALVTLLAEVDVATARRALDASGGSVRAALEHVPTQPTGRSRPEVPGNEGAHT
jgi:N-acetylmuramic acid 6-phosphate etherase